MTFEVTLYKKQAERISALTEQNTKLTDKILALNRELNSLRKDAYFYRDMTKAIADSEMLQEQWIGFIACLKLFDSDIPGITKPEKEF